MLDKFSGAAQNVSVRLIEISRTSDECLKAQLVGHDAVHAFGADTLEHLETYRLGGDGYDRTCYALMDGENKLHSAIYMYKDARPCTNYADLCGNVDAILHTPASALNSPEHSVIFYSITRLSDMKGSGEQLIREVYAHLRATRPGVTMSTLSPLRSADKDESTMADYTGARDHERKTILLDYLFQVKDPVQKFHMGNGALIGDIKLGADTQGQLRAMVNYIYPPEPAALTANQRLFRAEKPNMTMLAHPNLLAETGHIDDVAYNAVYRALQPAFN